MKPVKLLSLLGALALLTAAVSACNTVQGVGEDFKAAGNAIKDTAEETRRKIR